MEDLFEMFELIAEEGPIMEEIAEQLGELKTLNNSESETITKAMLSFDSESKKKNVKKLPTIAKDRRNIILLLRSYI